MERRLINRGKTSGRADDNIETIKKRFKTFVEASVPVVEEFEKQGKAFKISAERDPTDVFVDTEAALEKMGVPTIASAFKTTKVVFVLGCPGSGKGTQCEKILNRDKCAHLSAGDLLREEVASGSPLGNELQTAMKDGKLVPMEVTIGLLRKAMKKNGGDTFLIDGFPRAMDQAEAFESSIVKCAGVLFYECSEEEMERRLLDRGKTSGRADDNIETIKKRFKTFVELSKPVVEEYEKQGKAFKISAERHPNAVFVDTAAALDGLGLARHPGQPEVVGLDA